MVTTGGAVANGEPVDNDVPCRQTTAEQRQVIFFTCRSTMVNGKVKRGIYNELALQHQFKPRVIAKHWRTMAKKLDTLLSNHPDEDQQTLEDSQWLKNLTPS
jgi:hypothetical protein